MLVQKTSGSTILRIAEHNENENNFLIPQLEVYSADTKELLLTYEAIDELYIESQGIQLASDSMQSYITASRISIGSNGESIAFENATTIMIDSPVGTKTFQIAVPPQATVLMNGEEMNEKLFLTGRIFQIIVDSRQSSTPIEISGDRIDAFNWEKMKVDSYPYPLTEFQAWKSKGVIGLAIPISSVELNGAGKLVFKELRADTLIENEGASDFKITSKGYATSVTLNGADIRTISQEMNLLSPFREIIIGIIVTVAGGLILIYIRRKIAGNFRISEVKIARMLDERPAFFISAKLTSKREKVIKELHAEFQITSNEERVDGVFISQGRTNGIEKTELSRGQYEDDMVGWAPVPQPKEATSSPPKQIRKNESVYLIFPHSSVGFFSLDNDDYHHSNYGLSLTEGKKYKVIITIRGTEAGGATIQKSIRKKLV